MLSVCSRADEVEGVMISSEIYAIWMMIAGLSVMWGSAALLALKSIWAEATK
jgi:hypothetical protein